MSDDPVKIFQPPEGIIIIYYTYSNKVYVRFSGSTRYAGKAKTDSNAITLGAAYFKKHS